MSKWKGLIEAARHNDEQAVQFFIEYKHVPPTYSNSQKQTAAHIAAMNNNLPILKIMLRYKLDLLNLLDAENNNVLFVAVEHGSLDVIKYLVETLKVDIFQSNPYRFGNNAVHIAAQAGQLNVLKYFIEERNADVDGRNELEETCIFLAAERKQPTTFKYLVGERNANVTLIDWNGDNVLYVSAKVGDLTVPKYLLDERNVTYDIDGRDKLGETIVGRASRFDHLNVVKYFVDEKKADVNIADSLNRTPLFHAAWLGFFDIVKYLVEHGADPTIEDIYEKTPLKVAIKDNVIKYLKPLTKKVEERRRRSIPVISYESQNNRFPPKLMRRMITENLMGLPGSEFSKNIRTRSAQFHSFLIIADVCLRRYARSNYQKNEGNALSPQNILRRQMDPMAIEAVKALPDF